MIGFTGTQNGMTMSQGMAVLRALSQRVPPITRKNLWLAHGDCIGADSEVHRYARRIGYYIHLFPPEVKQKRAFCDWDKQEKPEGYLSRNLAIVVHSSLLIAAPGEMTEQTRSGTWATVRLARLKRVPIVLVYPDGTIEEAEERRGDQ